jgi:hypothetical protein
MGPVELPFLPTFSFLGEPELADQIRFRQHRNYLE